jgi:hypothetical protein
MEGSAHGQPLSRPFVESADWSPHAEHRRWPRISTATQPQPIALSPIQIEAPGLGMTRKNPYGSAPTLTGSTTSSRHSAHPTSCSVHLLDAKSGVTLAQAPLLATRPQRRQPRPHLRPPPTWPNRVNPQVINFLRAGRCPSSPAFSYPCLASEVRNMASGSETADQSADWPDLCAPLRQSPAGAVRTTQVLAIVSEPQFQPEILRWVTGSRTSAAYSIRYMFRW